MCIGAIDGKHVMLQKPHMSGSTFYNYKQRFSIQLLAVVDANYQFMYVDAGCQGRLGDAGVYHHSTLSTALESNLLNIPSAQALPHCHVVVPYVLVGDDAFPLKSNIMKPYAHRGLNDTERIFNYRLSRARRVVENSFGMLAARFRVFRTSMEINPAKARDVVLAATVLHNFMRQRSQTASNIEVRESCSSVMDTADQAMHMQPPSGMSRCKPCLARPSLNAKTVRSTFADYFVHDGQVQWQWSIVQNA